jgi:hypothetical protein
MLRSASKLKSFTQGESERESGYNRWSNAPMPSSDSDGNNRPRAVPPPPPTPEDGSAHLSVPPLEPPPSLGRALGQGRSRSRSEPKAFWVLLAVLFLFGTALTLYFQR